MKYSIEATPWSDRTALNMTRVYADSAGMAYLPCAQFFRIGQVNMGIQIQAVGAKITPSFTLEHAEKALNEDPTNQANVPWFPLAPVDAGKMINYPLAATAIRLQFEGAGQAYVISW